MTARTLQDAAAAPAALTAFLRGVERRAAVFAALASGSVEDGDDAVEATMRGFRATASRAPFADWSPRFWAALMAQPALRRPARGSAWEPPFAGFAALGLGPRAALLLRLVAGLSEAEAAAVLGVSRPTYRLALSRALPRDAHGDPDPDSWRVLGDAAQEAVRHVPPDRLAQLARRREAAIEGRPTPRAPVAARADGAGPAGDPTPRRPWPAIAAVAAATLLAFAATWQPWTSLLRDRGGDGDGDGDPRITRTALPPADAPAARWPADAALATHPDLALLEAGDDPVIADPAFHAWLAAGFAAGARDGAVPADAAPALPGELDGAASDTMPETADVP